MQSGHTPVPDLVRVLAEFCWGQDPDVSHAAPSTAIRPLLAYLAELGTFVSDSVILPPWVSFALSGEYGPDPCPGDAFRALVELLVVLPLEALPTVSAVVLDTVPSSCSATLAAPASVSTGVQLISDRPCASEFRQCHTCSDASLLLCLCSWRLGKYVGGAPAHDEVVIQQFQLARVSCRFEDAISRLLMKPHSFQPLTAVQLLKCSGEAAGLVPAFSSLLSSLASELHVAPTGAYAVRRVV